MRRLMAVMLLGLALVAPLGARAQEDKDRITRYLEETLSGLGREVRIEGFRGALSAKVTMDKLSIADDKGVWLVLSDAVLDWNRTAVLGGRIEINQLSAKVIEMPRLPVAVAGGTAASPEAGVFKLPELPVSVKIGEIRADKVVLGAPVMGLAATVSARGSMALAEGQGNATLSIARLDGPRGILALKGGFSNQSRVLALSLKLDEAADGIAARLLGLPGLPSVAMAVEGEAPVDNFAARVTLRTDGLERLAGTVAIRALPLPQGADPAQPVTREVTADVGGDLAPLFAPDYRAFFGNDVGLKSLIRLFPDGRVVMENLDVSAAALSLSGRLVLAADRLPEEFSLDLLVQDKGRDQVLLPLPGAPTRIETARLRAGFDSARGDAWTVSGDLTGLERPEIKVQAVGFTAAGTIRRGETRAVAARIDATGQGIDPQDPALAQAIGRMARLGVDLGWQDGAPLAVNNLSLEAPGLSLTGDGQVDGLDNALEISGRLSTGVEDLSRLEGLIGRPLRGNFATDLAGRMSPLTGAFDLVMSAVANDLGGVSSRVDAALAGLSTLNISVLRDTTGVTLRDGRLAAAGLVASATGQVATGKGDLAFDARLEDVGAFVDGIGGPASASGTARQDQAGWVVALDGTAPFQSSLSAQVSLPNEGAAEVTARAVIDAVGAILPDLPGSARIEASARQQGENWAVTASGDGPAGSRFNMAGQVAGDAARGDLAIEGVLPLALANRRMAPNSAQGLAAVDLRLSGPLAVSSLRGTLRTEGARVSLPGLRNALDGVAGTVTLDGSNAAVQVAAAVASGGRVTAQGRVAMVAPYVADIALELAAITVRDPKLFETTVNGALKLSGPVMGGALVSGQVNLGLTEVRVPSTGLGGVGETLEITHVNEPAAVHLTRARAGLIASADDGSGGGRATGLDLWILAENRIFLRGRGLDAELGGKLRLTGTTAEVVPIGQFELFRGRLDILGKRLALEEGAIRMQGDMIPYLRLVARTDTPEAVLRVIVEGRADAPVVKFVSEPDLPGDEVLARLLFGHSVGTLSALQAVQLGAAVATLAGRGGGGFVERLRRNVGVDDLDLSTNEEGETTLGVGKYLSEKIYTEVEIGTAEQSRINLNLDLTPSTTLRGKLGVDGSTGIGVFFEKDY